MDPLLRLTLLLSRWTRRRWTRTEAVVALGTLSVGALSLLLASDDDDYPPLHSVERPRS